MPNASESDKNTSLNFDADCSSYSFKNKDSKSFLPYTVNSRRGTSVVISGLFTIEYATGFTLSIVEGVPPVLVLMNHKSFKTVSKLPSLIVWIGFDKLDTEM